MNSMGYDPYQSGSGMDPAYEEEEEEEIEARNGRGGNVLPICKTIFLKTFFLIIIEALKYGYEICHPSNIMI